MKIRLGQLHTGKAGSVRELLVDLEKSDPLDWTANIGTWFIEAPNQSPAWKHYLLSAVHLRPIEGVKEALLETDGATHEFMLLALDPGIKPTPQNPETWDPLHPFNLVEQITVSDDAAASHILDLCADAVARGDLWAEPPLAGQVEPWRSFLKHYAKQWRIKHE